MIQPGNQPLGSLHAAFSECSEDKAFLSLVRGGFDAFAHPVEIVVR